MLSSHAVLLWPKVLENFYLCNGWQTTRLSTTQAMAEVIETIVGAMSDAGYPSSDTFGVRLALEEAIVNAIEHGHRNDPTKEVEVRYQIGTEQLLVEVEDQGPGFDPTHVPDPSAPENLERTGGRGLLLIRHYSTWVRHNAQGDCIAFCLCRSQFKDERQ
jgi:serine/threonine-protein kinase RsbW